MTVAFIGISSIKEGKVSNEKEREFRKPVIEMGRKR